jgi:hypothetical protein
MEEEKKEREEEREIGASALFYTEVTSGRLA